MDYKNNKVPERVKEEKIGTYYERNKEKCKAYAMDYHYKNREKEIGYMRRYYRQLHTSTIKKEELTLDNSPLKQCYFISLD